MGRWRKALAVVAAGMLYLSGFLASAHAQGPLSGLFQKGPEPKKPDDNPFTLPNDGRPNAFTSELDVRVPSLPSPGRLLPRPGVLWPTITPAVPAEFPNCAVQSNEPASPWTMREEGMPNGFTDYADPRPRPFMNFLHGQRRLVGEMLNPPVLPGPEFLIFRAEYLRWVLTPASTNVPLVTTTTNFPAESGAIGQPNTQILVPAGNFNSGLSNGFRLAMGLAPRILPPIEISGFLFSTTTNVFSDGSLTNPTRVLALPFQDVQTSLLIPGVNNVGTESAHVVAVPNGALGILGGTLSISSQVKFWNISAEMFVPFLQSDIFQVEGIVGYRHLQLDDTLTINTTAGGQFGTIFWKGAALPTGIFTNSTFDSFAATNSFDGGTIGFRAGLTGGRWSVTSDTRFALGMSKQTLNIGGNSTLTQLISPRTTQTTAGGIFALPSNSVSVSSTNFNVIPDMNLTLSYRVTERIKVSVGYDFLYWLTVARPGDYINPLIDSRQVPTNSNFQANISYNGPTATTAIVPRSFTAQGVSVAIEIGF